MNEVVERPAVKRVREALAEKGLHDRVLVLNSSAATAKDAAEAVGVELGAIVKSLLFFVGLEPVLVLVAGDRQVNEERLGEITGLEGPVRKANANEVQKVTGFTIGGVAPVGALAPVRVVIDRSLGRYPKIYAAAGHPHCLFETNLDELLHITGGQVSDEIAEAA
ncbi:Proline--tRNA ligase [bacterium HR40]|nr:Proline--tRNA ligase [bacterium HR40]